MNKTKPIRISSMGKYLPERLSSKYLEKKHGLPRGWSQKYSGVESRHLVTHECNGYMGARAAEQALDNGKISLADIDMIISASGSYDYPIPNQASIIKAEMKDGNKYHPPAIDIDSTCLSFVAALDFVSSILDGCKYKKILIVSSEISSNAINPDNWETLTLFGDGAAAAVIEYDENSDSAYIKGEQVTYSDGAYYTVVEGGGNKNCFQDNPYNKEFYSFKMQGKHLLKMGKKRIPEFIDSFFSEINSSIESIDVIIPHQASKVGLKIFGSLYDIEPSKIKGTLHKYGNCIAASIPLTLMEAVELGDIKRGDSCLLIGTSAGFSIGAVLIKY